jgi:hypothetical protein
MGTLANHAVIPGRSAGSSPERMTPDGHAVRAEFVAFFSLPAMFMGSGLGAVRRPGMTG